ncbi:hypothetical protein CspeluHIS016_0301230 [Cutaneotrichosporon spelunceum]|uniref:Enoyl reductase (ER) domain-containing protein n=1 Tax=Cutaneotrichosporon spelunceum TaxID=1672016 RepID=A0AAD3TTB3_9TREE|nr:hypothetical protein CspeluHIS016_0301230 [Cutaneotrichosporon spelunceum]
MTVHTTSNAPADLTNIPKKHKAAVYDKPGTLSIKMVEVDTPEPGQGEVLVRLTHSGVCHSDYSVMMNAWKALPAPTPAGQVGGHEGVGFVAKLGPGLENSPVQVGDRVGIKWLSAVCNSCVPCLSGRDSSCTAGKISGYYTPGTFQQYATAPASYVTPIPAELDSAAAAPQLCAGVTVYAAMQKADVKAGQFVVIMGAGGGLGHLACALASKGFGARVIGIDHGSKRAIAEDNGVEFFIDFTETKDVTAEIMKITGGLGAHSVLVVTASNAAYAQSLTFLRFGGIVVCIGVPEGDLAPVGTASPALLIFKELRLVGSAVGGRLQAIETLDFAARGVLKTHYKTAKLEDIAQVFQDMEDGKIQGRVVVEID